MDPLSIDFEDELFQNLCGGFESMVQRPPNIEEAKEIFKLSLYLYSFSNDVPDYRLSDFFVVSKALTYTGVELGMTDLKTKKSTWAGVYHYEEEYFFIHSNEDSRGGFFQISLLSSFVYTVPLFIMTKERGEFWEEFEKIYKETFH